MHDQAPETPPASPPVIRADLDHTTSTSDTARELIANAPPGSVVVVTARRQTAGRGRLGRAWHSPEGGAWLTLARSLAALPDTGPLALRAADAVVHALSAHLPDPGATAIRWPNDVLIHGAKAAGVLGESIEVPRTDGHPPSRVLLLGVGVNVNNALPDAPLRTPAARLADHAAGPIDLPAFVDDLVARLLAATTPAGPAALDDATRARIEARLFAIGQAVRLDGAGEPVEGVLDGIDPDGSLRLTVAGLTRRFASGELSCRSL